MRQRCRQQHATHAPELFMLQHPLHLVQAAIERVHHAGREVSCAGGARAVQRAVISMPGSLLLLQRSTAAQQQPLGLHIAANSSARPPTPA